MKHGIIASLFITAWTFGTMNIETPTPSFETKELCEAAVPVWEEQNHQKVMSYQRDNGPVEHCVNVTRVPAKQIPPEPLPLNVPLIPNGADGYIVRQPGQDDIYLEPNGKGRYSAFKAVKNYRQGFVPFYPSIPVPMPSNLGPLPASSPTPGQR